LPLSTHVFDLFANGFARQPSFQAVARPFNPSLMCSIHSQLALAKRPSGAAALQKAASGYARIPSPDNEIRQSKKFAFSRRNSFKNQWGT
jgi:hypothetical protein